MSELKPCPFCEGKLTLTWHNGEDGYLCNCCGVKITMPQGSITHLREIVNTRAEPEARALSLKELKKRIGKVVWIETMKENRIVILAHDGENVNLYNAYNTISAKHVLDNDGLIYDREPKEEQE